MSKAPPTLTEVFDHLEDFHGVQAPCWPTEPYDFLIWWHCGYPASDAACERGWKSLTAITGIEPDKLLAVPTPKLAAALKVGGMVPELRALRLKEIGARVKDELGGDLRGSLVGPISAARKILKKFPNIADPGADRILLFSGIDAVAAVPSNCPHVLVRILHGQERENYGVTYREAQEAIEGQITKNVAARMRAFLLVKQHGQTLCKRTNPKCEKCPLKASCAYYAGKRRGRSALA